MSYNGQPYYTPPTQFAFPEPSAHGYNDAMNPAQSGEPVPGPYRTYPPPSSGPPSFPQAPAPISPWPSYQQPSYPAYPPPGQLPSPYDSPYGAPPTLQPYSPIGPPPPPPPPPLNIPSIYPHSPTGPPPLPPPPPAPQRSPALHSVHSYSSVGPPPLLPPQSSSLHHYTPTGPPLSPPPLPPKHISPLHSPSMYQTTPLSPLPPAHAVSPLHSPSFQPPLPPSSPPPGYDAAGPVPPQSGAAYLPSPYDIDLPATPSSPTASFAALTVDDQPTPLPSVLPLRTTPKFAPHPGIAPLRVGSMRNPTRQEMSPHSPHRSQSVRDTASTGPTPPPKRGASPPIRDVPLPLRPPPPSKPTSPQDVPSSTPVLLSAVDPDEPLVYLGVEVPPVVDGPPPPATTFNPIAAVEAIQKATAGGILNAGAVINALYPLTAMEMDAVRRKFSESSAKPLEDVITDTGKGWLRMAFRGLALGPLRWDVELLQQALGDPIQYQDLLIEILFGRTNEEIRALKAAYASRYRVNLEDRVMRSLPRENVPLLGMVLAANRTPESAEVDYLQVVNDAITLWATGEAKKGTDEDRFAAIICRRSNRQLVAIGQEYARKYNSSLISAIKKEFSGFPCAALLAVAKSVEKDGQGHARDAELMEAAMVGWGTRDERLVWRVIRAHWARPRMEAIKEQFLQQQKQSLASRVKGELSGDYRVLMLALIGWSLRSESSIIM